MEAEVTGVCSTSNIELVKKLGAQSVIDYTQQDFTKQPVQYDIIFDVVGNSSLLECKNVLQPNGIYITTQPTPNNFVQSFLTMLKPSRKAKVIVLQSNGKDLAYLKDLIEAGKIRSIIDRTYTLPETLLSSHV